MHNLKHSSHYFISNQHRNCSLKNEIIIIYMFKIISINITINNIKYKKKCLHYLMLIILLPPQQFPPHQIKVSQFPPHPQCFLPWGFSDASRSESTSTSTSTLNHYFNNHRLYRGLRSDARVDLNFIPTPAFDRGFVFNINSGY